MVHYLYHSAEQQHQMEFSSDIIETNAIDDDPIKKAILPWPQIKARWSGPNVITKNTITIYIVPKQQTVSHHAKYENLCPKIIKRMYENLAFQIIKYYYTSTHA